MAIKIIRKDLPNFAGWAWLVQDEATQEHFMVSRAYADPTNPFVQLASLFGDSRGGWEVLVFPADADGNVTDWHEVAGHAGEDYTHEDAIADLEAVLAERVSA